MAEATTKITFNADTSSVDRAVAGMGNNLRKLNKEAELAAKGLSNMFKGEAFDSLASKFGTVQRAVDKYIKTVSSATTVKQELRATQQAATELEQAWRQLSNTEKQSAEGQALRQHIDQLIDRAGNLKDTMADVSGAISKVASDTRGLDVVAQGFQVVASTVQVATGALSALGVEENKVAQVQQKLTSLIAVTNGLQQIQNALQKESALMMKLSQVAAQGLNATIKANPFGAFAVVVTAVAAAVYEFGLKAKVADQQAKELNEQMKQQSSTYAEQRVKLENLRDAWANLATEQQKNQFIKDNKKEFEGLGVSVDSVSAAENLLVNNTDAFVEAMKLRAEAAAYAALAQAAFQQQIEQTEAAAERRKNPTTGDRVRGLFNMNWGQSFSESVARETNRAANEMSDNAIKAGNKALEYLDKMRDLQNRAGQRLRGAGISTTSASAGAVSSSRGGKATGTTAQEPARAMERFSVEAYQTQIKILEGLKTRLAGTDIAQAQELTKQIETLTWRMENLKRAQAGKSLADQFKVTDITTTLKPLKDKEILSLKAPKVEIETLDEKLQRVGTTAQGVASIMSNLGSVVGGAAGEWTKWGATVLQSIAQALPQLGKLVAANTATAGSEAMAQSATLGPFGWINGIAAIAGVLAAIATLPKFATGGIVGGHDHSDGVLARVSSGEMILNQGQQSNLFSMLNGGGAKRVEFVIRGRDLVGVERNYGSKMGKVK